MLFKYIISLLLISKCFSFQADTLSIDKVDSLIIESIEINGNEKTKPEIILRELSFQSGDTVSSDILKYGRERIFSLGLFSSVNLKIVKPDNKLLINVLEGWYIYPLPIVDIIGNSFDKLNLGLYLVYKNIGGLNKSVKTAFAFGYDPYFRIYFMSPYFLGNRDIILNTGLQYQKIGNKSPQLEQDFGKVFDYKSFSFYTSLGKRFDNFNYFGANLSFTHLEAPEKFPGMTASGGKIDNFISAGLNYFYDTRDLAQYPRNGSLIQLEFINNGFNINGFNFGSLKAVFKKYNKINEYINFNYKFLSRNIFGSNIPSYYNSFFGHQHYVRGHKEKIIEGKHQLLSIFEISIPILNELDTSIKMPFVPRKLTSARIGVMFRVFSDFGYIYNDFNKLNLKPNLQGYGCGLVFLFLPYNGLSIDLAFDENKNKEWIFGTTFSF